MQLTRTNNKMKKTHLLSLFLASVLLLGGCSQDNSSSDTLDPDAPTTIDPATQEYLTLSKETYRNKTTGGLLGQFAGFFSGYEFVKDGPLPYVGLPADWFEFINGPYAGNNKHFIITERYDRLREKDGVPSIWSDDDYHIDIFNQTIIDKYGYSADNIKDAWKYYKVHDWGGGYEASRIMNVNDYSSPFTGTLEAGNVYSWCTEAYIENETIGMDAAAMPDTANLLGERFGSVTGYFEPVMWAKLYATMYSYAYIYDDINVILEKSRVVVPTGSWPDRLINVAQEMYQKYPNDYVSAAKEIFNNYYRTTKGIDNIQTNPGINGAFAVYSMLYGQGDYMKAALASSMMGFDGDCTAATVCGLYGIMKGFHPTENEVDAQINQKLYQDGTSIYHNDTVTGFDPYIGANYPENQLVESILDLYQKNYEKILVNNGGRIEGDNYLVPVQTLRIGKSYLFDNYDLEAEELNGFSATNNTTIGVYEDGDNLYSHSGYRAMRVGLQEGQTGKARAYHTFDKLEVGRHYRLSTFIRSDGLFYELFAKDGENIQASTFKGAEKIQNAALIFKATSSKMDVGVAFNGEIDTDFLIIDDFMLEEIRNVSYGNIISNEPMKKYLSNVSVQATDPVLNRQMILRVKYRCLSDFDVSVLRNGAQTLNVPFYACSQDNNDGENIVEIPFEFKTKEDIVTLSFLGNSIYIQSIELLDSTTYLFR